MDNLFMALFLLSILGLIIGLIQPQVFSKLFKKKANRKTVGLVFGSAIVLFFILFGVTTPNNGRTSIPAKTTTPTSTKTTGESTPVKTPTPSYVFDVPSLLGKNIDQIRQSLGPSIEQQDPKGNGPAEPAQQDINSESAIPWFNDWDNGKYELLVDFNYQTRKVLDFSVSYIQSIDSTAITSDHKSEFETAANVSDNGSGYSVQVNKCKLGCSSNDNILGIKIIPQ